MAVCGMENQQFQYLTPAKSGLKAEGEVRSILSVGTYLLFGIKSQPMQR